MRLLVGRLGVGRLEVDGSTPLANCSVTRCQPTDAGGLRLVGYGDVEHEEEDDARTTAELAGPNSRVVLHAADLRTPQANRELAERAVAELGGVDVLVCNAAFQMALPGAGVGSARDAAVERGLAALGHPAESSTWVACTDAETVVPTHWLLAAQRCQRRGRSRARHPPARRAPGGTVSRGGKGLSPTWSSNA